MTTHRIATRLVFPVHAFHPLHCFPLSRGLRAAGAIAVLWVAVAAPVLAQTPPAATEGEGVATATTVEGTSYVVRADGSQRILARGSRVGVGDVLSTTRNSILRLRFSDGGETAVRPDSRVAVQSYAFSATEPQNDNMVLGLLRGGLRAITGAIGKRGNVDAYRLRAGTATIGIRGTDYIARLCDADCQDAAAAPGAPSPRGVRPNSGPQVIARVLRAEGSVRVARADQQIDLAPGAALYVSDQVNTAPGAHAVLAFRDDTRITLNSGTQLALAQYAFDAAQPARGNMLFRLLSGGLRVATGLVAKAVPRQVKFQTLTATVGVRGTAFDLACGRADSPEDPPPESLRDNPCDQALFAATRQGEISLAAADGVEIGVPAGQSGIVPAGQASARPLAAMPAYFGSIDTPVPETVDVNLEQLFGVAPPAENAPGVYVLVREGRIVLEQSGQALALDAGESAYAGQSLAPQRLSSPPPLVDRDLQLSNRSQGLNMCWR